MFYVLVDNSSHRIIKNVSLLDNGSVKYEAYMFIWRVADVGSFRLIYNNFGNCTAWKLNTETGIWGCFADQNDVGFDRKTVALPTTQKADKTKKHTVTLKQESPPTQIEILEKIEDAIANAYFEFMREHIGKLFGVAV